MGSTVAPIKWPPAAGLGTNARANVGFGRDRIRALFSPVVLASLPSTASLVFPKKQARAGHLTTSGGAIRISPLSRFRHASPVLTSLAPRQTSQAAAMRILFKNFHHPQGQALFYFSSMLLVQSANGSSRFFLDVA